MSSQRFYASPSDTFTWPNGAIGHRSGSGPFDCLGPFAKVRNCPIDGTDLRLTVYATGYADTFFSIPACTRYRGKHVQGFITLRDDTGGTCGQTSAVFVPCLRHRDRFDLPRYYVEMTDTFGGEANYCWVRRFKVHASSAHMAMREVSRETGYIGRVRKDWNAGEEARYNVRGACICFFVYPWDDDSHKHYETRQLTQGAQN